MLFSLVCITCNNSCFVEVILPKQKQDHNRCLLVGGAQETEDTTTSKNLCQNCGRNKYILMSSMDDMYFALAQISSMIASGQTKFRPKIRKLGCSTKILLLPPISPSVFLAIACLLPGWLGNAYYRSFTMVSGHQPCCMELLHGYKHYNRWN